MRSVRSLKKNVVRGIPGQGLLRDQRVDKLARRRGWPGDESGNRTASDAYSNGTQSETSGSGGRKATALPDCVALAMTRRTCC